MAWKHVLHPDFVPEPYWPTAGGPDHDHTGDHTGDHSGDHSGDPSSAPDVLVAGAGYAALHAALALARAGRSVCLVAPAPGSGGGDALACLGSIGGARWSTGGHGGLVGADASARATLEDVIRSEGIDCDHRASGHFIGASAPDHAEAMRRYAGAPGETGGGPIFVSREDQWKETGSAYYFGGLMLPWASSVNPARYHRGLLDACTRAGVVLALGAEIHDLAPAADGWQVRTSRGAVRAGRLVLADNALAARWYPALGRCLIARPAYYVATEPLPEELIAALLPRARSHGETARLAHAYRLGDEGQRIVFGGPAHLARLTPRQAASALYERLRERFPHLRGARFSHAWGNPDRRVSNVARTGTHDGLVYVLDDGREDLAVAGRLGTVAARRVLDPDNGSGNAPDTTSDDGRELAPDARRLFPPTLAGRWLEWRDRRDHDHEPPA